MTHEHTMASGKPATTGPSDERIRALLARYKCPTPFHEVRTRFLGNIASPVLSASPLEAVKELWGGELPEFEDLDTGNELICALVMGLWNRLTRHQERGAPFRLLRMNVPDTREGLGRLALVRREELDGFVAGLFGKEESIDLPERAHRALDVLSEMRAMLEGIRLLVHDPAKPTAARDISSILRQMRELTRIAEHEMHEAVLSCTRARRQRLAEMPAAKPVLH